MTPEGRARRVLLACRGEWRTVNKVIEDLYIDIYVDHGTKQEFWINGWLEVAGFDLIDDSDENSIAWANWPDTNKHIRHQFWIHGYHYPGVETPEEYKKYFVPKKPVAKETVESYFESMNTRHIDL